MPDGIFSIMCPVCGAPRELPPEGPPRTTDDVILCAGCACAFVVRFGHALTVPRPSDRGAA